MTLAGKLAIRALTHDNFRVIIKSLRDLRVNPRQLRRILTVIAGLVIVGGLVRLAVDDQVVAVSYQELDYDPAP